MTWEGGGGNVPSQETGRHVSATSGQRAPEGGDRMSRKLAAVTLSATLIAPVAASAHTGVGETSGFLHGFLHPLGGADHLLAMVAVGMLGFAVGGRALWLLPATFVLTMMAGGALGVAGLVLPALEPMIALSVVALAGLVASGRTLPLAALVSLTAIFALFHGVAHGAEMPAAASGLLYGVGFALATALLHATGLGLSLLAVRALAAGYATVRIAAAVMSLAGLVLFIGAL